MCYRSLTTGEQHAIAHKKVVEVIKFLFLHKQCDKSCIAHCTNVRVYVRTVIAVTVYLSDLKDVESSYAFSNRRYGFVNVCNAALELLSDEDEDVRSLATVFVSRLTGKEEMPTAQATEALVLFGLEQFGDCISWFQPLVDLLMVPWRDDWMAELERSLKR